MGSFGTSTATTSGTASNKPLAEQMPYLTQGWAGAGQAMNTASGAPKPTNFVAGFDPRQMALYQQMLGYGSNTAGAGSTAAGGAMTGAGVNAMSGAFGRYSNFNPTTQSNIDAANKYANDPSVGGRVDAAMHDSERAASEHYLPQIAQGAAATGNRDSSKTEIQQGLVARGLAEKRAGIDANMRGDLYSQGLGLAQNQNQQDLSAILGGAGAGTQAASAGVNATGQGVNQQGDIYGIGAAGGTGATAGNQANINDMLSRYQFGVSSPFDALNAYWNIVGSNNWGGTQNTTGTSSSTASPASVLGGLMGAAGSIIGGKK